MRKRSRSKQRKVVTSDTQELFRHAVQQHQHGKIREAIAAYDRIVALKPDYAEAHAKRAVALSSLGQHAEALASYERVIAINPDNAYAYYSRCDALFNLGRHDEAIASCERAIALDPSKVEFHNKCGSILRAAGRPLEAIASFDHAIALRPDYALAHNNRGNALSFCGRCDEALESFERAIAINPAYANAHNNHGIVLYDLGRLEEALVAWDQAIHNAPDNCSAHLNRGIALQVMGRHGEALSCFDRSLALNPNNVQAQFNKAMLLLQLGNYQIGFELYEWRWHDAGTVGLRHYAQPQWRGEPVADKTILLHDEQGFGDTIQMLRYLPLVKAKANRVILCIKPSILPLLGPMADGVELKGRGSPLPPFDVHCPLMSLPLPFGTRVETIPAQIPYLTVPVEQVPVWQARLPKSAMPRVGLAWSGSPKHRNDRNRSIALDRLAPLLNVSGVSFVSLHREYRDDDLAALAQLPIKRIDDAIGSFGDTAAAINQCDLVISVDTAVAHLAGSLGKKLWLLLPFDPDWRWLLERTDSPWYPTARLFRQSRIGDWESVIAVVARELAALPPEQIVGGA